MLHLPVPCMYLGRLSTLLSVRRCSSRADRSAYLSRVHSHSLRGGATIGYFSFWKYLLKRRALWISNSIEIMQCSLTRYGIKTGFSPTADQDAPPSKDADGESNVKLLLFIYTWVMAFIEGHTYRQGRRLLKGRMAGLTRGD